MEDMLRGIVEQIGALRYDVERNAENMDKKAKAADYINSPSPLNDDGDASGEDGYRFVTSFLFKMFRDYKSIT